VLVAATGSKLGQQPNPTDLVANRCWKCLKSCGMWLGICGCIATGFSITHLKPVMRSWNQKSTNKQAIYANRPQPLPCKSIHLLQQPLVYMLRLPIVVKQTLVKSVEVVRTKKKTHKYGQYLAELWFMQW